MQTDIAIVGGGIVGLATAYHLAQTYPQHRIAVLEKEAEVAFHQTGRNSGVIHSGVYYKPGSLKAENCFAGKKRLVQFCEEHDVAYEMCGKVIVAAVEEERAGLQRIYERGQQNGVACEPIGPERLRELEPHVRGVAALHVPEAGICDYGGMSRKLAELLREAGHEIVLRAEVTDVAVRPDALTLTTSAGEVQAQYVVNCAGLYADRVAALTTGARPGVQVLPFRGEYYELKPHARHLCRNLIYPVPDPSFPFLGVHFTRMVSGAVECGPSAVLAFAREGYTFTDVDVQELVETLTFPGFRRLSVKHWRKGLLEIVQSLSKRQYLKALRHLIPEITLDDLAPAPSGVRAQAVTPGGDLVDDFLLEETDRVVNVLNAASPAATASLNVGRLVGETLAKRF